MDRWYFLAYLSFTFFLVAAQTPKYVLKGKGEHLKPDIPGQPNSILWKHNGNKVVEFDGSEQQVYDPYRHRITLNWITAELEISDLRYEDTGDYELEVDINNKVFSSESQLEVIDKVATPTISCELNDGSSTDGSEVKATLLCSAEPRRPESLTKFEWRSQGKLNPGNKLPISLGDTQSDEEHVCTVSNPVSSEKATFRSKDCYQDENSSVALGVGLFFLVSLLVGALVGTVLFLKMKQKACFAKGQQGDVEKQSPAKDPTDENRPLMPKGLDRAETFASHQPLGHLPQNHETSPDQLTAGKKGSVKDMARVIDNRAANNGQSPAKKRQGLKGHDGEREPASPPLSPLNKDQDPHGKVDKGDDGGNDLNKVQHSDQSDTEEENEPNQSDTCKEKPEDKQPDVESAAERQVSKTENQQNLAGGEEPEDTAPDPEPTPEQPDPTDENRPLMPKGLDRAETFANPQPLGHLPQNHETSPDQLTAGKKEDGEDHQQPGSSVKEMARVIDNRAANNGQSPAKKRQGLKGHDGEREPASPPLSPFNKDQDPHGKVDKGDDGGNDLNKVQHSDQSDTEEENEPNQSDTCKEKPENKQPDVESTAERQDSESTEGEHLEAESSLQQNHSPHTNNSEDDQEEDQANKSTKDEVQPSDLSGSKTENQLNPAGGGDPEDTAPDPKTTPEQPEADVSRKEEDHQEELKSEQPTPEKSHVSDLKGHAGKHDTVSPVSSSPDEMTLSEDRSDTEKGNGSNQTDPSEEKPEDAERDVKSEPGADQKTAQGDGNSPPLHREPTPPPDPLPGPQEQDDKKSQEDGDTNSEERKDAKTGPGNNQSEDKETPSVPATEKPHDVHPNPPLNEGSAGLDAKVTDGGQQTESTAETGAKTINESNPADVQGKNESDESVEENSSEVPGSENSDTKQEQHPNGPDKDSNIKETNSQKNVEAVSPAPSEDVSEEKETDKNLGSAPSQQPQHTTPTGDPSTTGGDQPTTGSEVKSDSSPTEADEEDKEKKYVIRQSADSQ